MKQLLLLLISMALALGTLAGCGGSSRGLSEKPAQPTAPPKEKPISLTTNQGKPLTPPPVAPRQ
jgi:hypothetical protein